MYTPETSRHFTKKVDPVTGMYYYVLSTRVAPIQQGFYFINSGADESRRYLWFYCAFPPAEGHCAGVVDFASDEVYCFRDTLGSGFMVDPLTGELYWGNSQGIYRRAPHPDEKPQLVARMPEALKKMRPHSLGGTHLTFSPDRKELFVDVGTMKGSYIGTINVVTGEFTEWHHTVPGVNYNHGQYNPVDPDLGMCAHEMYFNEKLGKTVFPELIDGVYPRIELIHRDGTVDMIKPLNNFASHEFWAPNGKSLYYCSSNQDLGQNFLDGSEPRLVCHIPVPGGTGNGVWHAHCTYDENYFIVDAAREPMWRGIASLIRFYNRKTDKICTLIDNNPVVEGWSRENQSIYHIDPHPRFIWNDEWVSFTTTVAGTVDVGLAPVQQLIDATE